MANRMVLINGSGDEVGTSTSPFSIVIRNSSGTEIGTDSSTLIVGG